MGRKPRPLKRGQLIAFKVPQSQKVTDEDLKFLEKKRSKDSKYPSKLFFAALQEERIKEIENLEEISLPVSSLTNEEKQMLKQLGVRKLLGNIVLGFLRSQPPAKSLTLKEETLDFKTMETKKGPKGPEKDSRRP